MAGDINVGEGIALQTRATPYRGTPITTGLRLNQANQLKQAEMEARKQRAKDKREADLNKMINITPISGIHPRYQEKVRDTGLRGIIDSNNPDSSPIERGMMKFDTLQKLQNYNVASDRINAINKYVSNRNNLVPSGFAKIAAAKSSEEGNRIAAAMTPEQRLLGADVGWVLDESDPEDIVPDVVASYQKVNIPNKAVNTLAKATGMSEYDLLNKKGDFQAVVQKLNPEEVANMAKFEVDYDNDFGKTLIVENWDKAQKILQSQPANLSDEEKLYNTKIQLANDAFKSAYKDKFGLRFDRPYEGDILTFGNGFGKIGKQTFNFDTLDVNQAEDALRDAGVIKGPISNAEAYGNTDIEFKKGSASFLGISPPAITSGNVQDQDGNTMYLDNVRLFYAPGLNNGNGQWLMIGNKNDKSKTVTSIPVTDNTIGPVASLYKTSIGNLEKLMSERIKQGQKSISKSGTTRSGQANSKLNTTTKSKAQAKNYGL